MQRKRRGIREIRKTQQKIGEGKCRGREEAI